MTSLASRVHRVMFSQMHSLSCARDRRPLDPVPNRLERFFSLAGDSEGVRCGRRRGDETREEAVLL
jgi:hypothetical protein